MKQYKKIKDRDIIKDNFGLKDYARNFSLYDARILFYHRSSMTRYFKINYKGSKEYTRQGWKCEECSLLDTEDHLHVCKEYEDVRKDHDLNEDKDMAQYLHKIYIRRTEKANTKST